MLGARQCGPGEGGKGFGQGWAQWAIGHGRKLGGFDASVTRQKRGNLPC
jgi:hypothetical protein